MEEIFHYFRVLDERFDKTLRRAQAELLAPHGLIARHAPYLLRLAEAEEGLTLSELSRAVCYDKANTTRVVRCLQSLGFAARREESRGSPVTLTPEGKALAERLCARMRAYREGMLSALSEEERASLLVVMKKLSEAEY